MLCILTVSKVEFASSYYNSSEDDDILSIELVSSTPSDFPFYINIIPGLVNGR